MINVIFNTFDYEILPKQKETYDKYCKIIQWGRKYPTRFAETFLGLTLTDAQKYIFLSSWLPKTVVWLMSRSSGKCLNLKEKVHIIKKDGDFEKIEKIPLQDLKLGDFLIGKDGKKTKVIQLHPIVIEDEYIIEFSDGEKISCNKEHLWEVYYYDEKTRKCSIDTKILSTEELLNIGINAPKGKHRFFVPKYKSIQLKEREYKIEPYIFGLYCGGCKLFCQYLKDLNCYNKKYIPEEYKYGSIEQRIDFLKGYFDSDGSVNKDGESFFVQKDEQLMNEVKEIMTSLGITYGFHSRIDYDKRTKKEYIHNSIHFRVSKENSLFELERKHNRLKDTLSDKMNKKAIVSITKTGKKVSMRCVTVDNEDGTFVCGEKGTVTHNSYLSAPFTMVRSLLFPSHQSYIMAPSGSQSVETFTKLENLSKNNIASVLGVTSFFLDECVRMNSKADPYTHDKSGHHVGLYNGSGINTLNSVVKNIVGIRSNMNLYDEAGKIDRDYFALTVPFTVQNTDFATGANFNQDIFPRQVQNKNIYMSSAEGIDSELFDQYKLCMNKMLLGDPDYFVVDQDCNLSLHPFINGKPAPPLVSQSTIDDAFATNPYKATREYMNIFDQDGGMDVFVKRSTVNKFSQTYYPIFENEGNKTYIIAYDPASKLDNSMIIAAELFEDEEKGLMVKFIYAKNLIEKLRNGEKVHIQKPKQIEILKDILCDFNKGAEDYDNIDILCIDAGAGGGGFDIGQFLMNDWKGKDKKMHRGLIDKNDQYMALRIDEFPTNIDKLRMFNFKRDKVLAYERAQSAISQGLVIFPNSVNARNELEFEVRHEDESMNIRYEKVDQKDLAVLIEFDLMKEELVATQKIKTSNGNIKFDLSPDAKSRGAHDDRADCAVMILNRLMELRAERALHVEKKQSDFKSFFDKQNTSNNKNNPFGNVGNPFKNNGGNPFIHK